MTKTRKHLAAAIAAIGALAIAAPSASADFAGFPAGVDLSQFGANGAGAFGPCARATAEGQGATGTADPQACAVLAFVGPATGQISTVIGPTIIGPAVIGTIVVSAGHVIAP